MIATALLDPTAERQPTHRPRADRLRQVHGATIGLLDISKPRGDLFLDRLQAHLEGKGAKVVRFRKPTFAKNAPPDLRREIAQRCDAVLEALAD